MSAVLWSSAGFCFLRLEVVVVVAGVGGGTLMAVRSLKGGMLGTVEALFDMVPECAVDDAREFLVFVDVRELPVFVVLVENVEGGLRASKESMRPLADLISTAATGSGTLMADTEWIASPRKSAGREKLFPESCRLLARGNSSSCWLMLSMRRWMLSDLALLARRCAGSIQPEVRSGRRRCLGTGLDFGLRG